MPKRSAQARIERYARKIQKIEEQERRRRVISPLESSSDDEGGAGPLEATGSDNVALPEQHHQELSPNIEVSFESGLEPAVPIENSPNDTVLDPELLSALGESISETPDYGPKIHDTLSKLWLPLLKKGMPKEDREKLEKEYLIPDNCRLLQAPALNAEISAAVPDMVRNRDKALMAYQRQLGCGITAVNKGIDMLLKSDDKIGAMKHLSNGCRLLCDSHHSSTQNRIKLVTPSLDKSFLHMINGGERDETLFGTKLSEKIKTAKTIEKQGLQIKKLLKPQKAPANQPSARPSSFQGNWTAPPRYLANRGGRGGYRKTQAPSTTARRPYSVPAQQSRRATQDKSRAPAPVQH